MKSKEEIEQLARDEANDNKHSYIKLDYQDGIYYGFIKGYTQCQVDMQKDVEYWQGEFEHWYRQAMDMSNKYNELLNKQDNE